MNKYFQVKITALECSGYFTIFGCLNLSLLQTLRFLEDASKLIYVAVNFNTPCNNDLRGNLNDNSGQYILYIYTFNVCVTLYQ